MQIGRSDLAPINGRPHQYMNERNVEFVVFFNTSRIDRKDTEGYHDYHSP
jgi:hypothetical protein